MKKWVFIIFSLVFLISSRGVYAQDFESQSSRAGTNVVVAQDEVIDRSFFASGKTVTISGTINGDLYAAGGTVIIDGTVNGDVLAAGGVVRITGEVSQDIRAAGGQITIAGTVGHNTTAAGGNIDISPSANLNGSLVVAGGNLIISSPVEGNINAGVGNLTISESVAGDIEAAVGTLTLTPQASVAGQINYWSEEELYLAQGASVSGSITRNDPRQTIEGLEPGTEIAEQAFLTTGRIILFFSLLIIGLLLVKFAPNYTKETSQTIVDNPLRTGAVGLVALIITPIVAALLMMTLIGIPLGLILLATYFIYLYISRVFFIYWIGEYTAKRFDYKLSNMWIFVVGTVVYAIIAIIPIIGGLFKLFTLLFGLGAMLLTWKETYKKLQKQKLV